MKRFLTFIAILVRILLVLFLTGFLFIISRIDSEDELQRIQFLDIFCGILVAGTVSRIYEVAFGHRDGHRKWKSLALFFVSWILFSGSMAAFHDGVARARWYVPPSTSAMSTLKVVSHAVEDFLRDCGDFPLPDPDLSMLMMNPGIDCWSGPYIELDEMKDPWGTRIRCDVDPKRILVRSAGPDRIFDTTDDLTREVKH